MERMNRQIFLILAVLSVGVVVLGGLLWPPVFLMFVFVGPLVLLGLADMIQTKDTIRRNFPLAGRLRHLALEIRPMVQQYFIESDISGRPLNKLERSVIAARAAKTLSTSPFGTQTDVYAVGYEWMNHSLAPAKKAKEQPRIRIGGKHCTQPYEASVLNISAMSFGSLSANAVQALNEGARLGHFYHNTGEGGLSPHHLQPGGDICWQLGTGYFGCRTKDGAFDPDMFTEQANRPQVKLIELKLSQGAKPGKGGILPAAKITEEIAEIRGVEMGVDVISPSSHSTFSTPTELMEFIQRLRDLAGGKPVGFKLCVGKRREFLAVCKAMIETGITPDFISVDGGEGGTGAAPLEFADSVGTPLVEGLIFVHNALVGFGLRDEIRIIASGKVTTAFGVAKRLAIGADICAAARAFMLSLGCIQALKCNTNRCPVGVATQDPVLVEGLDPEAKATRVYGFHAETVKTLNDLLAAAGLTRPEELRPWHIMRRTNQFEIHHYGDVFEYLESGDLLEEPLPQTYERACKAASSDQFGHAGLE